MTDIDLSNGYTEAEAKLQVRALLNEATEGFYLDDEIENWLKEGAADVAVKTLCVEKKDTITLVTNTFEYDDLVTLGADKVPNIIKVHSAIYDDGSHGYLGLVRINPRMMGHLAHNTADKPRHFWHFAQKIGIWPPPSSTYNGKTVMLYFSYIADDITDLPYFYQGFPILYAAAMGKLKARLNAEAHQFYMTYVNSLNFHRADLYMLEADSKDMFEIPDSILTP